MVRPGKTLSDIFDEEGLGCAAAMAIANLGGDASQLKTLRPGEKLSLRKTDDDALDELNYEIDDTHTLQVRRTDAGFDAVTIAAEIDRRPTQLTGIITSRSEEHTSELQSLMRISYAVFCLKKKKMNKIHNSSYNVN